MAALGRFLFLVFTYGIMRIRHYWPVAISTAVSDAFLVVKIFFVFTHVGVRNMLMLNELNHKISALLCSTFIVSYSFASETWKLCYNIIL